jgi:hypothetical protein
MDDLANLAASIDEDVLRCLRHVAAATQNRPSLFNQPCSAESIRRLKSLGLIEVYSSAWLPLEMRHACFRTSHLGDALLRFLTN